jgi:hypothetical protein
MRHRLDPDVDARHAIRIKRVLKQLPQHPAVASTRERFSQTV